jgi:hypothetical protein
MREPCSVCGERSVVALGEVPTWFCQDHFEERVADLRSMADEAALIGWLE